MTKRREHLELALDGIVHQLQHSVLTERERERLVREAEELSRQLERLVA